MINMRTIAGVDNYDFYATANLSQYSGEWVAILNKKVVAHGKNLKEVLKKAKESFPQAAPFIAKVPSKEILIW